MNTTGFDVHGDRFRVDTPVDLSDNTGVESAKALEEDRLDEEDEPRLLEAIAKSDAQIARSKVIPAEEALARLHARRSCLGTSRKKGPL